MCLHCLPLVIPLHFSALKQWLLSEAGAGEDAGLHPFLGWFEARLPAFAAALADQALPTGAAHTPSRRRDCHSAAPPSPFSRCFNTDEEGVPAK